MVRPAITPEEPKQMEKFRLHERRGRPLGGSIYLGLGAKTWTGFEVTKAWGKEEKRLLYKLPPEFATGNLRFPLDFTYHRCPRISHS